MGLKPPGGEGRWEPGEVLEGRRGSVRGLGIVSPVGRVFSWNLGGNGASNHMESRIAAWRRV